MRANLYSLHNLVPFVATSLLGSILILLIALFSIQSLAAAPSPPKSTGHAVLSATPTPPCGDLAWQVVSSPNHGRGSNTLYSVSAISPSDIWAVGWRYDSVNSNEATLTLHWNGNRWDLIASPSLSSSYNELYGVTAISASDVWAVGRYHDYIDNVTKTLILHWDGTKWSHIPGPNPGSYNYLASVSAVSSTDVWAVGYYDTGQPGDDVRHGMLLHWDGASWSHILAPAAVPDESSLTSVEAISSNDVWAVGIYGDAEQTLTLHWDGSSWTHVPSPNQTGGTSVAENFLTGVSASSSTDVWAVGYYSYYEPSAGPSLDTLALHWDGSTWSIIPTPNADVGYSYLFDVHALSPNAAWAVGYSNDGYPEHWRHRLIQQWDGTEWSIVHNPDENSELHAVAALSADDVWAVGFSGTRSLTEHYTARVCLTPTATPDPGPCPPVWSVVETANYGARPNKLLAVDALSPTDIWAVGEYGADADGHTQPLIEHWNGITWSIVPSPPITWSASLNGITAISPTDIWAVGSNDNSFGKYVTLIEHWDGTSWHVVSSPTVGLASFLTDVSASAPDDVWAVGYRCCVAFSAWTMLVMRWNGTEWSIVPTPKITDAENVLLDIEVISENDVWAAGYTNRTFPEDPEPLILHWDGSEWRVHITPTGGKLFGIQVISPDEVWAVGYSLTVDQVTYEDVKRTLVLRWNGNSWNPVPSPNASPYDNELHAIAANSPNDIWAAGSYYLGARKPLVTHWDGSTWSVIPGPVFASSQGSSLEALTAISAGDIWAVGDAYLDDGRTVTLAGHYESTCMPTVTGTPIVTSTPTVTGTPTAMGTAPTATSTPLVTATATPPACTISFSDVHPSDFFYEPVRALACRGVVSGYADGTFRPSTNTTRGQLSKMVVRAVAFSLNTSGGPHFSDVSTTNPFYEYIETAYNLGIITGYEDGTFRWGNNVTRGQLCKIIVLAKGWPLDLTGSPHFNDVEVDSPFYVHIETAYNHGLISGYADGSFRWNLPATRGQISKIVYNATTEEQLPNSQK
ncbi:MAG TPA: S-layer homology domain-containing protein [Chloroflexia bacterium]|jgi:hypothetical protein